MTRAELHSLVDALPDAAVENLSVLMQRVINGDIDPEQVWFWTPEWQRKEREVDERLTRGGRGTVQHSNEEFLAALDARHAALERRGV